MTIEALDIVRLAIKWKRPRQTIEGMIEALFPRCSYGTGMGDERDEDGNRMVISANVNVTFNNRHYDINWEENGEVTMRLFQEDVPVPGQGRIRGRVLS